MSMLDKYPSPGTHTSPKARRDATNSQDLDYKQLFEQERKRTEILMNQIEKLERQLLQERKTVRYYRFFRCP